MIPSHFIAKLWLGLHSHVLLETACEVCRELPTPFWFLAAIAQWRHLTDSLALNYRQIQHCKADYDHHGCYLINPPIMTKYGDYSGLLNVVFYA